MNLLTPTYLMSGTTAGASMLMPGTLEVMGDIMALTGNDFFLTPPVTPDQDVCYQGLCAIENSRMFDSSVAFRKILLGCTDGACRLDLAGDIRGAFELPDVVRLSGDEKIRRGQEDLIDRIVASARSHRGIMMLFCLMKENLGSHFYHSLRSGLAYCSLRESFDRKNILPLATLALVGVLHDVGKLEVPEEILGKPGNHTYVERKVMERHNDASRRILTPFEDDMPYLADIAVYHHPYPRTGGKTRLEERRQFERWMAHEERNGHDRRTRKRRSPKLHVKRAGTLLRMADSYDALASRRDYRPEMIPADDVEKIMRSAFSIYNVMVNHLLENFPCPKPITP